MTKLNGKVALVTGGSSGIGLAIAKRYLDEGAYVYITGRRADELEKAKSSLGKNLTVVQGDVSNLSDLDRLYKTIQSEKGVLHTVVANAGVFEYGPVESASPEHFDKIFDINVRGLFFTVQKAIPLMTQGGSVILVSSGMHSKGHAGFGAYSASKAAVRSFSRTWASELHPKGIRVNTLSPGATDTPILAKNFATVAEAEEGKKQMGKSVLMGRIGLPEEVATAALFLASNDSSYTTGADLPVDGGSAQV